MEDRPELSVVIPARDQRVRLERTLDSIERVDFDLDRLEVIVIDDGSSDGTFEAVSARDAPYRLIAERGEFSNQSAATNAGIALARGEIVLCSAQDILFDPRLPAEHVAWHDRFDGREVAVLGYLPYAPDLDVTPFMFYLTSGGFQFAYYLIKDPLRVPPNFVYAPNVSLRRSVFERVGTFDERFPFGCQDTDLGIRLAAHGVGIVYNERAVGYHNHPVGLHEFYRRQRTVGRALVHLEAKHPHHEGGIAAWDLVLGSYLATPEVRLDRAERVAERLEPHIAESGDRYKQLWQEAYIRQRPLDGFCAEDASLVLRTQRLFQAYNDLLQFHWARGYFEESLEVHGRDETRRRLEARLSRTQASAPLLRAIERRLEQHGTSLATPPHAGFPVSRVVHGLTGYDEALRLLAPLVDPQTTEFNVQVLLAVERGVFSTSELEKLDAVVETVVADDASTAVLQALQRCTGEQVEVCAAGVRPASAEALRELARQVFERWPKIAVLGGNVATPDAVGRLCGFDASGAPIVAVDEPRFQPVDVVVPEYCVIRQANLSRLLSDIEDAQGRWHDTLCRGAARAGLDVFHLPAARCDIGPSPEP